MSPTQFTLFFVALLVGYVLVHLRLVRFEEHLRKLAGIRGIDERLAQLDERVQGLAEATEQHGLGRITQQLDVLHEDLEDLREATKRVGEAVVTIPASVASVPVNSDGSAQDPSQATPAARIVALIEARLLQLGYRRLRLLGDLGDAQFTDEVEVQVEAERNGMPCKGRVVARNGSVSDVHIQTVAQSFP